MRPWPDLHKSLLHLPILRVAHGPRGVADCDQGAQGVNKAVRAPHHPVLPALLQGEVSLLRVVRHPVLKVIGGVLHEHVTVGPSSDLGDLFI